MIQKNYLTGKIAKYYKKRQRLLKGEKHIHDGFVCETIKRKKVSNETVYGKNNKKYNVSTHIFRHKK